MREDWLPPLGNVSQSCISRQGAPVSFSQVSPSTFSWALIGWFTCATVFLSYPIMSLCVCSMFYSKSPWEARAFGAGVVQKISWLVLMFCCVSWGEAGLIPVLFVWGVLSDQHPPPFAPEIFFRTGAWSGANSNRDLPVCPLSGVTPTGVAFFTGQTAYRLLETHRQTDRQSKLLAQAAMFAHAWRW